MKPIAALLIVMLLASCYREKRDNQTLQRLAQIEQRLDAQDKALAELRAQPGTTELTALAGQLADLHDQLDTLLDAVKQAKPARGQRREPDPAVTYSVPLGKSPVYGSPKAKVTLVMAMDFDCPFCRKAWDTVEQLRQKYGPDLRVAYKPYVVHPKTAKLAAEAACGAQKQGKWREMAQLIWTQAFDQRANNSDAFSPAHMTALAKQLKLDMNRYAQDVAGVCVQEVRDEMATMTRLGVGATPTFFINGRYVAGALPIDKFSPLIDEELAKATAAEKRGVKPEQYYEQEIVGKGTAQLAQP
ncbi:MAG TPA: DsbA family protein [Kofleriaceae bacterium]|nr:DsbA family protein [Kofleriaceae bacterium]